MVVGLDEKMSDIEKRITKLEEDDLSTVAFRSVNETIGSEDNSKEEKAGRHGWWQLRPPFFLQTQLDPSSAELSPL